MHIEGRTRFHSVYWRLVKLLIKLCNWQQYTVFIVDFLRFDHAQVILQRNLTIKLCKQIEMYLCH